MIQGRDHGGALDAACARWGGSRDDWVDLSTGINPVAYPLPDMPATDWTALPDVAATRRLEQAARRFWAVPDHLAILAAPGASCLIAALPRCLPGQTVQIRHDTYNEHAAAFRGAGWTVGETPGDVQVVVHPNNPTGTFWAGDTPTMTIVDESFCDTDPGRSLVATAGPTRVVLKSFGKFWGLAGLRLGFLIGTSELIARVGAQLGPWPVAGPALRIGEAALGDTPWASATRHRLAEDAARLDRLMLSAGARPQGDCPLFRLYTVADGTAWQDHFAQHRVLTRIFPYAPTWLRLGLPAPDQWHRVEAACGTVGGAMAQPSAVQRP